MSGRGAPRGRGGNGGGGPPRGRGGKGGGGPPRGRGGNGGGGPPKGAGGPPRGPAGPSSALSKPEISQTVTGARTHVARPNFGTMGKKIRLAINGFQIQIPDHDIMRYDVVIEPEKVPKDVTRKIVEAFKSTKHPELGWDEKDQNLAKQICYDGQKIMYSPAPLKSIGEQFAVFKISLTEEGEVPKAQDQSRLREFTLKLRRIKDVSMEALHQYLAGPTTQSGAVLNLEIPYESISCLEVLLRQNPILRFATNPSGRSFYGNEGIQALPDGLEVHYGWFQSLRSMLGLPAPDGITYKQLMVNIDVAATAFYQSGPLLDVVANFFKKRHVSECKIEFGKRFMVVKLDKFLTNLNVDITYRSAGGRRKYKLKGIAGKSAIDSKVVIDKDGQSVTISVFEYFKKYNNITLQHPWLPCVVAGGNNIQIPMELCVVRPNQRYVKKINDMQAAEMIKVTAVRPAERQKRIMDGMNKLHGKNDSQLLSNWGVTINNEMVQVEGRVLAAPPVAFKKKSEVPRDGTWQYDRGNGFVKPAVLRSWAVSVFGSPQQIRMKDIENFLTQLGASFDVHGIDFCWADRTEDMVAYERRPGDHFNTLSAAKELALNVAKCGPSAQTTSKREVDIIICILPQKTSQLYNEIKRCAETELGIVTQCCLSKFVQRPNRGYFSNIVLKINTKLGGINSSIAQASQLPFLGENVPTMVIGADVTHPPAGARGGVSIAAVVASVDRMFCDYRAAIRVQTGRKEIIEDLEGMVIELVGHFKALNRITPRRILFYRDGVSEGQFGEVVYNEIAAIKRAYQTMQIQPPTITFLSVNKRHHIRFFALDSRDADKNGNVPAGTCVDTGVVHPYEFDFFLNSHPGLQGTSRPTHYHVLYDENNFNADSLQNLTYRLCYFYARSNRAVSLVPAAYYSHLVAARARAHIFEEEGSDTASIRSGNSKIAAMQAHKVLEEVTSGMYFV